MKIIFSGLLCLVLLAIPCAGKEAKGHPTDPIEDVPGLPRVLLIGDSISIGYTLPTRADLAGVANVHRIPKNGGPTDRGLENIDKWIGDKKWDVIHFNWGLHDLCYRNPESKAQGNRDKENGTVTNSVETYTKNLDKLATRLKETGATLIFATTTPVPEGEVGRKVGDDVIYNEAALGVMRKQGIEVNDLYAVVAGKMSEYAVGPGNVHFKKLGSELLAEHVAQSIEAALEKGTESE